MSHFSNEHAYSIDPNGQGQFTIFTSKYKKHSVRSIARDIFTTIDKVDFDSSNYEPNPTVYIYTKTYQYTLVLPANIDDSAFAKCIHQCALKSLIK